MSTTFMNLTLPTVSTTLGPDWATELNAALTTIDSHTHTAGQGNRIPTAGININASLDFGEYAITDLGKGTFTNLSALDSDNNTIYVKDGDWYLNDGSGNQVRITAGGALNVGSVGGISGDYGSTAATMFYTDASLTYFLQDSASAAAKIDVGAIAASGAVVLSSTLSAGASTLTSLSVTGAATVGTTLGVSGASTLAALTTSGTLTADGATVLNGTTTLAGATAISGNAIISGDANFTGDATFTGNTSGRGIVPIGAVLPLMANLTGITDVTATTAADANGFVVCGGQTISDATSPMDGVTIPNINNNVFLMGNAPSGTTGGANSYTLSTSQLPSHTHGSGSYTTSLSGTFASTSHSHNTSGHARIYVNTDSNLINIAKSTVSAWNATESWTFSSSIGTGTGNINITGSAATIGATTSTSGSASLSGSNSVTGNSSSTGSGSSIENRPSYISTKFIIRIR